MRNDLRSVTSYEISYEISYIISYEMISEVSLASFHTIEVEMKATLSVENGQKKCTLADVQMK